MMFHKNQLRELRKGLNLRKWSLKQRLQNDEYETFEEREQIISAINTDDFLLMCIAQWESRLGSFTEQDSFNELFKA